MKAKKILIESGFHARFEDCDHGWSMPQFSYHESYEIYILEEGERTVVVDDKIFNTTTNDAALFNSGTLHKSYGDVPFKGFCFHFTEQYLSTYFSKTAIIKLLKCFSNPVISLDVEATDKLRELAYKINENTELKFVYLSNILEILSTYMKDVKHPLNTSHMCSLPTLSPIMTYINENYASIKSIKEISLVFNLSESYLCRIFKKHTGMTLTYYINNLKIQFACHRLSTCDKTVAYIAEECGYESSIYFVRIFKKLMGITPSEFRKNSSNEKGIT